MIHQAVYDLSSLGATQVHASGLYGANIRVPLSADRSLTIWYNPKKDPQCLQPVNVAFFGRNDPITVENPIPVDSFKKTFVRGVLTLKDSCKIEYRGGRTLRVTGFGANGVCVQYDVLRNKKGVAKDPKISATERMKTIDNDLEFLKMNMPARVDGEFVGVDEWQSGIAQDGEVKGRFIEEIMDNTRQIWPHPILMKAVEVRVGVKAKFLGIGENREEKTDHFIALFGFVKDAGSQVSRYHNKLEMVLPSEILLRNFERYAIPSKKVLDMMLTARDLWNGGGITPRA